MFVSPNTDMHFSKPLSFKAILLISKYSTAFPCSNNKWPTLGPRGFLFWCDTCQDTCQWGSTATMPSHSESRCGDKKNYFKLHPSSPYLTSPQKKKKNLSSKDKILYTEWRWKLHNLNYFSGNNCWRKRACYSNWKDDNVCRGNVSKVHGAVCVVYMEQAMTPNKSIVTPCSCDGLMTITKSCLSLLTSYALYCSFINGLKGFSYQYLPRHSLKILLNQ